MAAFIDLTSRCAQSIVADDDVDAPQVDFTDSLPAAMNPQALLAIYTELWRLQTEAGLALKAADPQITVANINAKIEEKFEEHRVAAYRSQISEPALSQPSEAQLNMVKAYLTFASSKSLAGYESGKQWASEF